MSRPQSLVPHNATTCGICLQPIIQMTGRTRRLLCRCGCELQYHAIAPPHQMTAVTGCVGFVAQHEDVPPLQLVLLP